MAEGELPVHEKETHRAVKFERPSTHPSERCGNCINFISQMPPRCKHVASPIFINAWCRKWKDK